MPVLQTSIAPLAVRGLMPKEYLKQVQVKAARRGLNYSDTVISSVVREARTTHALWPIVMSLAKAEKRRRDEEAELNAAYLKASEA